jgi:4-hydroxy-tetrahydrodipicolinate synthase
MKFQGSFPALITPYKQDGTINTIELAQLSLMHMHYSDGLVLCGSTGEGWLLDSQEQRDLFDHVHAHYTKPIILNTSVWSATSFQHIVTFLGNRVEHISAFLLAAPPYLKLNENQLMDFFKVCANSSPIPIIAYHIPSRNGVVFTPKIMEFFSEHPNIVGIKETCWQHFEKYLELPNLIHFAGDDEFLTSPLVTASINVGGNIFPEYFAQRSLFFPWGDWQKLLAKASNPLVIKALMQHQGIIAHAHARDPLGTLDAHLYKEVVCTFEDLLMVLHQNITALELTPTLLPLPELL